MLPGNAILLNGVLQVANREIGAPRKIKTAQPLRVTAPGQKPLKQQIPGCARDDRLAPSWKQAPTTHTFANTLRPGCAILSLRLTPTVVSCGLRLEVDLRIPAFGSLPKVFSVT